MVVQCKTLINFRLHYGAVNCGGIGFGEVLDRLVLAKSKSRQPEKSLSCRVLRKVTDDTIGRRLRRKMTNFDAIIMRVNDSSNAYILDPTFEMKYFISPEYRKSKERFVNTKDISGHTALHVAAFNNNIKGVKMLLKYGACPFIKNKEERVTFTANNSFLLI